MYEFWFNYIKPNQQRNAKLCYMDTDSFIFHIKTKNIYEGIMNVVEKRLETSNDATERPVR